MAKNDSEKERLRLKIKAYDHKLADTACRQIVENAKRRQKLQNPR